MSITKNFLKASGIGIFIAVILFLSGAPSWGDTRLMVDQAPDGSLRETIWNGASQSSTASANLPGNGTNSEVISCAAPVVNWDSSANGWIIFGVNNDASNSMWAGTVTCSAYPPSAACTLTYTTLPTNAACPAGLAIAPACLISTAQVQSGTSYSTAWNPPCEAGQWQYGPWTPSTCTAGSIQTRTATGSPAGCVGTPDQPTVQSCVVPVNGTCGSSNGGTFSTTPTNLCNTGTASTVTLSGTTWSWNCGGLNGGTTASCQATYGTTPINGACGSANGTTVASAPTTNLCSAGAASAVSGTGPWTWSCAGSNGGTTASCTAYSSATSGSAIPLTFNAGSNSFKDTLGPGAEKVYVFTVPTLAAGTGISASVASIDQKTDLNVMIEQGSMSNMDTYYSTAISWYSSTGYWGYPYYKSYPPAVWARISGSLSGELVWLKPSTSGSNTTTTAVTLPGVWYMLVKNNSTCSTCNASYYVAAQTY